MQSKHYALTAVVSAIFAMSAQAQTSTGTPSQVNVPTPTETQSGQVPDTQPITMSEKSPARPGVGTPASREDVRSETRAEMKAGNIPRGEQSTASQGSKSESTGSEVMWQK